MEASTFVSNRVERMTMMRNKAILMGSVLLFAGLAFAAQHHSVEARATPELERATGGDAVQPPPQELEGFGLAPVFTADPGVCSVEQGLFGKPLFVADLAVLCPLGFCGTQNCLTICGCPINCDRFGCCNCVSC